MIHRVVGWRLQDRADRAPDLGAIGIGWLIVEYRQIHEDRVFAQQASVGPAGFENEAEIGFAHHLVGGQDHIVAASRFLDPEANIGQQPDAVDIETGEIVHRGHLHGDILEPGSSQIQNLDSDPKWLI